MLLHAVLLWAALHMHTQQAEEQSTTRGEENEP